MPCFTASDVRLVRAHQENLAKARPRTNETRNRLNEKFRVQFETHKQRPPRNECDEFLQVMGYNPTFLSRTNSQKAKAKAAANQANQTLLQQKDLERLQHAAKEVSLEERLQVLKQQEEERNRKEAETEQIRLHFKKIDDARKKALEANAEHEDLFGAGEKVKVLERAFLAKHEQEEEVKRVNRMILNAKCQAVRDAQIQEKSDLERQMRNEEKKLEKMVLDRAVESLKNEDEQEQQRKEKQSQYSCEIKTQLNERENLRFLEAERQEQEAKIIRQANEAIKREEEYQAKLAHERKLKFREELDKVSEMAVIFRRMLCEQEREADMRVAAYMRAKRQKERELATEKKLTQDAAESKRQRIFMLAKKMLEAKSQSEELSYIREQERIEREYRRKEKEAAQRKRQLEKDLADARERQLRETKHRQALQIARAEQDFDILMEQLKQSEQQQKAKDEEREKQNSCYRQAIIRQMNDKEMARRRLLELERAQAFAWRDSERQRDANIRAVVNAKLAAMRDACLPEKYIKDVEMQLNKIKTIKRVAPPTTATIPKSSI